MAKRLTEPPDGGYGWVVLSCCAICLFNVIGLGRIVGLVFVEVMDLYDVTRTQVFLVQVLHRLFGFIFAPVVGKLFSKFDCNVILCTGSLLISLSLILTACTTAYWQILITYGCMQGLGTNFVMAACQLTVGLYFKKRRSLAMGILYMIAGVSAFVFPMLFNVLLEEYGFNGAILIMGGIALHSCAVGMLVRQPTWLPKPKEEAPERVELQEQTAKYEQPPPPEGAEESLLKNIANDNANVDEIQTETGLKSTPPRGSRERPSKMSLIVKELRKDLTLFKDGHFLLQLFNRTCAALAFTYFWTLVPDFAEVELEPKVDRAQVAFILSMSSIGEIVVRFAAGSTLDFLPWPKKHSLALVTILMGLTALTFQFVQNYHHVIIGTVLFGQWIGMFVVVQLLVEMELMGPRRVHMANGLTRFVVGITNVVGGVVIGYLRDSLGSYKACLSLLGGLSIVGGLIWVFEPLIIKCFPLQGTKPKKVAFVT